MFKANRYRVPLTLIGCAVLLSSCATTAYYRILNAPVVSMTHSSIPAQYRLRVGRTVFEKFCEDDKPIKDTGKFVGLADQALYKAQKETKSTHLIDVLVTREGDCVTVEGNSARALKIKEIKSLKSFEKRSSASESADTAANSFEWTEDELAPDEVGGRP